MLPLRPGRVDRAAARRAVLLAPAVGLALGLAAAAVLLAGRWTWDGSLLASVATVAFLAAATRGLHLDGLADTADGLACYAPPERALAVMRSPEVGPLGAASVVLVLLGQVVALSACVRADRGTESLLLAVIVGRLAVVAACAAGVPAARPDGLGALVAGTAPRLAWLGWAALVAAGLGGYGYLDDRSGPGGALRVLLALGAGLGAARLLQRHAVRRLGGVTGDVLGALVEVAALVTLAGMAAGGPAG